MSVVLEWSSYRSDYESLHDDDDGDDDGKCECTMTAYRNLLNFRWAKYIEKIAILNASRKYTLGTVHARTFRTRRNHNLRRVISDGYRVQRSQALWRDTGPLRIASHASWEPVMTRVRGQGL